jgi:hypothetical protein
MPLHLARMSKSALTTGGKGKTTHGARSAAALPKSVRMKRIEALPEMTDTFRQRDFAQRLSRSRIYQDYKLAFEKTTNLPLELSPIDAPWRSC